MPAICGLFHLNEEIKMSKLTDLLEQRGKIADKIQDMQKHVENWTDENNEAFTKLSNSYDDISQEITKVERDEEVNKRIETIANEQTKFNPVQKPNVSNTETENKYGTKEYEQDFKNYLLSKGKVQNALQVGTDSEGGYVVAESWETELNRLLFDTNVMRQVSSVRTYDTDRNIPLTASVGAAGWIAEEGSYPTNSAAFATKKLLAHKLGNIEQVSEELLNDTFINLRSELGLMYADSFASTEETAFTTGDGSGKPTGFVTDATSAFAAASTTALTYNEVIQLMASLDEKYARNSIFMSNRSTASALRQLADSNGMPLWQPAMTAGMPDTLFGKPYRMNESMANLAASSKSLAFGDFNYYRIADRNGLVMQVLSELYAGTGQVGFKFMKRTDGILLRADAIKVITQAAS